MVGQAGKPKTITGFQTHSTPVLLAYGERAELATEECSFAFITFVAISDSHQYCPSVAGSLSDVSMSPYLEGLIILKKNPDYEERSKK